MDSVQIARMVELSLPDLTHKESRFRAAACSVLTVFASSITSSDIPIIITSVRNILNTILYDTQEARVEACATLVAIAPRIPESQIIAIVVDLIDRLMDEYPPVKEAAYQAIIALQPWIPATQNAALSAALQERLTTRSYKLYSAVIALTPLKLSIPVTQLLAITRTLENRLLEDDQNLRGSVCQALTVVVSERLLRDSDVNLSEVICRILNTLAPENTFLNRSDISPFDLPLACAKIIIAAMRRMSAIEIATLVETLDDLQNSENSIVRQFARKVTIAIASSIPAANLTEVVISRIMLSFFKALDNDNDFVTESMTKFARRFSPAAICQRITSLSKEHVVHGAGAPNLGRMLMAVAPYITINELAPITTLLFEQLKASNNAAPFHKNFGALLILFSLQGSTEDIPLEVISKSLGWFKSGQALSFYPTICDALITLALRVPAMQEQVVEAFLQRFIMSPDAVMCKALTTLALRIPAAQARVMNAFLTKLRSQQDATGAEHRSLMAIGLQSSVLGEELVNHFTNRPPLDYTSLMHLFHQQELVLEDVAVVEAPQVARRRCTLL